MRLFAETQKRRDRIQILADIIFTCIAQPSGITRILRHANIGYNAFKKEATTLQETGYLKNIGERYTTTPKGVDLCQRIHDIYKELESS